MADPTKPAEAPPLHAFEIRIHIGGNTLEYVERMLDEIRAAIVERKGDVQLASGGGGGCHSVTGTRREITSEDYNRELLEWCERNKASA